MASNVPSEHSCCRKQARRSFWNKDGSINFAAFVAVQVLRGKVPIQQPAATYIATVGIDQSEVPWRVHSLLSRQGFKTIPARHSPTLSSVVLAGHTFCRNLRLRHFFRDSPDNVSHNSELQSFRLPSTWDPLHSQKVPPLLVSIATIIDHRLRLRWVRQQGRKFIPNFTLDDFRAIRWLRQHSSSVCVLESDKNMGPVICSQM